MPAILDTRQLPRVDRIAAAAAFLEHTDTPIRLASNAAEQLGRRFSGWQLAAGVQVLDMEGSGLRMTRSARQLRTLARERLCLAAQFRGEDTLEHMGITGVTAPRAAEPGRRHQRIRLPADRLGDAPDLLRGLCRARPAGRPCPGRGRSVSSQPVLPAGALVPEQPARGPRGASGDSARSRVRRCLDRAYPRSGSHQLTDNATSSLDSPSKRPKALNLLMRLDTQRDDVLRFATVFSVAFDDNLCERDVRKLAPGLLS